MNEETTDAGRTKSIAAKVTPLEYARLKEAAAKELPPVSTYIRRILLHPQSGGSGRGAA